MTYWPNVSEEKFTSNLETEIYIRHFVGKVPH